ncbi:hypothetical protein P691DRAFT_740115 [Macrolepiota fuliginosa MF-IS2]|uniref:DUF3752 domain-containing protein n=1 Tax=Macrolepiota fuliginosa MF-IS2 TaxID=1400762 RepID=A0A9P6BV79_9AGAR|nr:hypothetical protein P691DRAFT_740115 [Macrolepiota fuliginosa MF-IS2]
MIGPEIPAQFLQNANTNTTSNSANSDSGGGPSRNSEELPNKPKPSEGPQESSEEITISVGPQIPIELLQQRHESAQQEEEEEEEDDYTPALPPELQRSRLSTSKARSRSPSRPSFPAHPSYPHPNEDSDDDDVGPKPLPLGLQPMHEKDAVTEFIEREERRRKNEQDAKEPKALKREEWMLVPPSASDLLGNLDTTKLKARQFARTSGPVNKGDNSLWTETPAERQQRIADEVAGKKRRAVDVANEEALDLGPTDRKRSRREEENIRRGVDDYTRKLRGPSLVDQHSTRTQPEDEDESKKGIWDHARDMSVGGRLMDDGKRKQMIRESKGLGDRFGSGKGGSFL